MLRQREIDSMRIIGLMFGALFFAMRMADAEFFTPTYAETVATINSQIAEVMSAKGLSGSDSAYALKVAAGWFYFWPCKGSQTDVPKADGFEVTQAFNLASPRQPNGSAILEVVAILVREGNGRTQNPYACQFAKDILNKNTY